MAIVAGADMTAADKRCCGGAFITEKQNVTSMAA
jgi:hypothetical protein